MSVYLSGNGDIWEDGVVIPADPRTPKERDERLMVAVGEVGQLLARLARAYGTLGDLAALPGAAGLRAVAHSAQRLATEMQAAAEAMDAESPDRRVTR